MTIAIGLTGTGHYLARLFNPGVMGVFMFLFGVKLIAIFLKGMLGIPFGGAAHGAPLYMPVALVCIGVALVVAVVSIKAPAGLARYALLVGIIVGWPAYALIFGAPAAAGSAASVHVGLFPLGAPAWNVGIIVTAVITGLLNTANTFGALKGTDELYGAATTRKQYRWSFTISGVFVGVAGLVGLVPFAPYVSSIGFLSQTGILKRLPFLLGGAMFVVMGVVPPIGRFFALLPLGIGAAVLFVPYLQLLNSAWQFFRKVEISTATVYRVAAPLFVGIVIMTLPAGTFGPVPAIVRPLVSSGLLVGIILALLLENLIRWDHGVSKQRG